MAREKRVFAKQNCASTIVYSLCTHDPSLEPEPWCSGGDRCVPSSQNTNNNKHYKNLNDKYTLLGNNNNCFCNPSVYTYVIQYNKYIKKSTVFWLLFIYSITICIHTSNIRLLHMHTHTHIRRFVALIRGFSSQFLNSSYTNIIPLTCRRKVDCGAGFCESVYWRCLHGIYTRIYICVLLSYLLFLARWIFRPMAAMSTHILFCNQLGESPCVCVCVGWVRVWWFPLIRCNPLVLHFGEGAPRCSCVSFVDVVLISGRR